MTTRELSELIVRDFRAGLSMAVIAEQRRMKLPTVEQAVRLWMRITHARQS